MATTEIAVTQGELVPIAEQAPVNLLSVIAQAALNPAVDVEKMRALLELKERIDENDAKKLFHAAMIAAQEDMRPVVRNCKSDKGRYANLEAVERAIRPIYIKHGFVLSFNSKPGRDGAITMSCTCMHKGGYAKEYELSGDLDIAGPSGKPTKTGIQATGSTTAYLRRYLECLIFNVVLTDEDDDGASSGEFIGEGQVNHILDMLLALNMDGGKAKPFLDFMGVKSVEQIPVREYPRAVNALQAKLKRGN